MSSVVADRPQLSIKVGKLFELVAVIKKDIDDEDQAEGKSSGMSQLVEEVKFIQVFACYWFWSLTGFRYTSRLYVYPLRVTTRLSHHIHTYISDFLSNSPM